MASLCGICPRTLGFSFASILFNHSNLHLPVELERKMVRVLTTPRLHGIHHSNVREEADTNWSSGISIWDRLHGTIRVDVPQDKVTIGMPAYSLSEDLAIEAFLRLPFQDQRDDWRGNNRRLTRPDRDTLGSATLPN